MANFKSLVQRSVSGAVFALLTVFCILFSRQTLMVFLLVVSSSVIWEYLLLTVGRRFTVERWLILSANAVYMTVTALYMEGLLAGKFILLSVLPAIAALVCIMYDSTAGIRSGRTESLRQSDFSASAHLLFPLLYVTLPFSCMYFISKSPQDGAYEPGLLMCIVVLIWMNDIFAYIFGTALGQRPSSRKLFPSLSPKKSVAGAVGGTSATFASAIAMYFILGSETLGVVDFVVLSAVVSVFGVYGDLFESLLKRFAGVKDAGNLIPGHGGTLDRFDGFLFVLPLVTVYLVLFSLI